MNQTPEPVIGPPRVTVNAYDVGQDIADWDAGDILDVLQGISNGLPAANAEEFRKAAQRLAPRTKRLRDLLAVEAPTLQDDEAARLEIIAKALMLTYYNAGAPSWESLPPASRADWLEKARAVLDSLNAVENP